MEENKLKPQQIKELYNKEDEPLIDYRTSSLITLQRTAIFTVLIIVFVSFTIKIPLHLKKDFKIVNSTPELTYSYSHSVYILKKFKKTGDKVKKNDKLVTISSLEIAETILNLNVAKNKLNNFQSHTAKSLLNEIESIKVNINKLNLTTKQNKHKIAANREIYKKEFDSINLKLQNALEKLSASEKLQNEGYLSKFQIQNLKENIKTLKLQLKKATKNKQIAEQNLITQNKIINQSILNFEKEIQNKLNYMEELKNSLKNNVNSIQNKIRSTYGNYEITNNLLTLLSPQDGILSYLAQNKKEIKEGEVLLRLIPKKTYLKGEIIISPMHIGQVKPNQQVNMKISSFPSFKWGTLKGKITTLSTTPDEKGNFHATILFDKDYNKKLISLLYPGMTGTAAIKLDKKTFIQYLFEKLR